jgi:VanZ family protein
LIEDSRIKIFAIKVYGIKFGFSGPRTFQRRGMVEGKFQTFFSRIRSMLNCAGLMDMLRKIWAVCAMTTTHLSNITSKKVESKWDKCPHKFLYFQKGIRCVFTEMGIVITKDKIQSKLEYCGSALMSAGYSEHHFLDVY